ncbi:nucleotide exchange factor GrpE [Candidatus Saccharibacteria bacterium]|nr:MAG: nucleotide exchange factor GrpE [Candidatus Saccharibacteria bacterium]
MTEKKKSDHKLDYKQIAEQLAAENAQLTEALQRERADAMNIRRRHDEQISSLRSTVKASVVKDLLPVIDNFERAIKHLPAAESHESRVMSQEEKNLLEWVEGVKKILLQFEKPSQKSASNASKLWVKRLTLICTKQSVWKRVMATKRLSAKSYNPATN